MANVGRDVAGDRLGLCRADSHDAGGVSAQVIHTACPASMPVAQTSGPPVCDAQLWQARTIDTSTGWTRMYDLQASRASRLRCVVDGRDAFRRVPIFPLSFGHEHATQGSLSWASGPLRVG
jgi:hypothetical protein